jgi:hypothetical protein
MRAEETDAYKSPVSVVGDSKDISTTFVYNRYT